MTEETTNEVAVVGSTAVGKYDDDIFNQAVSSEEFLTRMNLMTSNSKVCKSGGRYK